MKDEIYPKTETYICQTPEETFALGEQFGASLAGGEVVLLEGGLGAGKTLFVKGVMNALGLDEAEVTSPSFTLVNIYQARFKVFHIDLYRLNDGAAAGYAVDLDEILQDEQAIVLIEWAERLQDFPLPETIVKIAIKGDGDEPRLVSITSYEL
ncbi:MAG: tRNA (adenosine(37)-N6)-threonylcarbamoyltransferase complex ATPase subunit type 1 TsaE [Pyrinomonadaceae bacterium]